MVGLFVKKLPDFFTADLTDIFKLFVKGNVKKSGAIILHYERDHRCVSGHSPAELNPDCYTK